MILVTVDGVDGSGKSLLAGSLGRGLEEAGVGNLRFELDWFRRAIDWGRRETEADAYYEDYFDFPAAEVALTEVLTAGRVEVPVFDSVVDRVVERRWIESGDVPVLIAEGIFMRRLRAVEPHLRIWLDVPLELALDRLLRRDLRDKARAEAEVARRARERYFPAQARYRRDFHPMAAADVVLENEDVFRVARASFERLPTTASGRAIEDFVLSLGSSVGPQPFGTGD